jgi:uncharacterized protein YecE (DUF72 family)
MARVPIGTSGITGWKKQGCDVFVYFDNDQKSAAPADGFKSRELLARWEISLQTPAVFAFVGRTLYRN